MNATTEGQLCLHEIFEWQAATTPDAIALECGDRIWTYAELDQQTNRLARFLREFGAGPQQFVSIYMSRSELPIIAILACHKTGAAYVPIDPAYPDDRIKHITSELDPVACLTDSWLAPKAHQVFDTQVIVLDAVEPYVASCPAMRIDRAESGVAPSDLAYVIYTSGTTGRPKGVMTEHRAATWYVRAFNEECRTGPGDRVYQGFSLSFDGSVEEIWMAFSNGSALVVPTRDAPRFGDDLGRYLADRGITYFSTVPTMLSTLNGDIPSLRTVVLSGEVCPSDLVARWATAGRRLFNVYGPTEATVNTTIAECRPGETVTIGRPLIGYGLHVVDERLDPVPWGAKGELLISGPTLARGYLGQLELTAERFVEDRCIDGAKRFYRTGDLVRWTSSGDLEFHGRIDSQVKIRGYRIELAEIESVLGEHPQIRTAAVHVVERDGLQQLAACVLVQPTAAPCAPDRESILSLLERRLPAYMVPGYLDVVDALPRTTSGKIDRRRLPSPVNPLVRNSGANAQPRSELESRIVEVWQEIFGLPALSVNQDFFLDLGGHSIVAARMVTRLRQRIPHDVTVRDVYERPTIRQLAAHLELRPNANPDPSVPSPGRADTSARAVFHSVPRRQRTLTFALQALSTYLLAAVPTIPVALLFTVFLGWLRSEATTTTLIAIWLLVPLVMWPVMLVVSVAAKWTLIGRYKPGDHPLWSSFYFRWWLCQRIQTFSGVGGLTGTPLLPLYFRLMGARVGPRCTLDTAQVSAWDLVSIGSDTSIGADSQLLGYRVEDGMLRLGTVDIGKGCFVGIHSAVGLDTVMQDGARLDDQSLLPDGDLIPSGEGRSGSPARPAHVVVPTGRTSSRHRRFLFGLVHLCTAEVLGLLPIIPFAAFIAAYAVAFVLGGPLGLAFALVFAVPVGITTSCLMFAFVRRLVLWRMEPGTYPVESFIYVRKWLSDGIMKGARAALLPVYTTLYLPPWLRLMGARIGPRAELSTVWNFAPELIDVGPESFFADGSIIGGRRVNGGEFQVSVNRIGRRSFVGNSAILPVGSSLGDGCLLGVQSVTPAQTPRVPNGTEWLGSPPFALTYRQKVGHFDDSVTFRPTRRLYLQRAVVDGLRILIPAYLALVMLAAFAGLLYLIQRQLGTTALFLLAPVVGFGLGLCSVLFVAALKKCVMGTYGPETKPLWSMYVWLNEMVNGSYESVVAPVLAPLLGTPLAPALLRLMGCRIGRHTYIATTLLSEWDLVEIGDYAALNHGVVIQNHLFEDRVFKSSHLKIGPEVSVGNMTVILYDTEIGRGAWVGPLSLLMKGETLRGRSRWHGIPTEPVMASVAPDHALTSVATSAR